MSSPLYALLLVPCLALSGIKTNFERIGLRRIKFGGTFQIRKSFRGVRAGRAADYLADPQRVLAAAWPPHLIGKPTTREDGVLDYALEQETINFAGLLTVDGTVDMEVRQSSRGGVTLTSKKLRSVAKLANGQEVDVPIDFELTGRFDPQAANDNAPAAIRGAFEFSVSADLVGPLLLLPNPALKAAAVAVNRQLDLGGRFTRGILGKYPAWARANPIPPREPPAP
jgi:hypothetical protein